MWAAGLCMQVTLGSGLGCHGHQRVPCISGYDWRVKTWNKIYSMVVIQNKYHLFHAKMTFVITVGKSLSLPESHFLNVYNEQSTVIVVQYVKLV